MFKLKEYESIYNQYPLFHQRKNGLRGYMLVQFDKDNLSHWDK